MMFEHMEEALRKEASTKVPLRAIMAASLAYDEKFASFVGKDEVRLDFVKPAIDEMVAHIASENGVSAEAVSKGLFEKIADQMKEVETTDPKRIDPTKGIGGQDQTKKFKNIDVAEVQKEYGADHMDFPYGGAIEDPFKPGSLTGTITDGPENDVNNQGGAKLAPYSENSSSEVSGFGTRVDMPSNDGTSTLVDGPVSKNAKEAAHYPWDKCIADRKAEGHSNESANKICGYIKAKNSSIKEASSITPEMVSEAENSLMKSALAGLGFGSLEEQPDPAYIAQTAKEFNIDPSVLEEYLRLYPGTDPVDAAIEIVEEERGHNDPDEYRHGWDYEYEHNGPDRPLRPESGLNLFKKGPQTQQQPNPKAPVEYEDGWGNKKTYDPNAFVQDQMQPQITQPNPYEEIEEDPWAPINPNKIPPQRKQPFDINEW